MYLINDRSGLAQFTINQMGMVLIGIVGIILVLAWVAFAGWRIRASYLAKTSAASRGCPLCRSSLRRVHRTRLQRTMCILLALPIGRYRCSNRHCHWQGLL